MKTKIITLIALIMMGGMHVFAQKGKTLIAYFSWGGNTEHVAKYIAGQTGGDAVPHRTHEALPHGIQALHRGGQGGKGKQRPPGNKKQGGKLE